MNRNICTKIGRWELSFSKNVHMHCRALSAVKGEHRINLPCEDLPTTEKTIGIWLYDIDISDKHKEELQAVLLEWANSLNVKCKVYVNESDFVSNS